MCDVTDRPEFLAGSRAILVVEDERIVRRMTARLLDEMGFRVYEADGADEALAVLRLARGGVDLVLTDVVMPSTGGVALARAIAREHPGLPIVFFSAHPAETLAREGLEDLRVRFLAKPFTRADLLRVIHAALGGASPGAAPDPADARLDEDDA